MVEDEEVWAECSDEEKYNPCKLKPGTWQPKPEDILRLCDEIKANKVLALSWQCPGRRPPELEQEVEVVAEVTVQREHKEQEKKPVEPNEFDFDDGPQTKTVLTPRRTPGSAPRSEKKVARMDKVLKDMMYQRKLAAAEREARRLAKSPRAPTSPGRVRLGSPAGSPRTPPAVGLAHRQSPVRLPPTPEPGSTPLRAPIHDELPVHTPGPDLAVNGTPPREGTTPARPREVSQPGTPVTGVTARVESPTVTAPERASPPGESVAAGTTDSGETSGSVPGPIPQPHSDVLVSGPGGEHTDGATTSQADAAVDGVSRQLDAMDTS